MRVRVLAVLLVIVAAAGVTVTAEPGHAATAAASTPSAPRSVTATALVGGVTVRWSPPASSGGCAISSYQLRVLRTNNTVKATKTVSGSVRATSITGLVVRSAYLLEIRARNCVATSGRATKTFVTKAKGAAPMADTAIATYWLPGGLGGVPNTFEIWVFDPVSFSVMAGRRMVYTKIGTLPYQKSLDRGFTYTLTGPKTFQMKFVQTTSLGPEYHEVHIDGYDAANDILKFTYDRFYTRYLGGCRYPETPAWICVR